MESETGNASEVGKLVDEWVMIDGGGQEHYVGMVGERTIAGSRPGFVEAADGPFEVVIVGPADAAGRRRLGLHRRPSSR